MAPVNLKTVRAKSSLEPFWLTEASPSASGARSRGTLPRAGHRPSWQVIGKAELFPIFKARVILREELVQRDVICFIDNDSARQSMVKGYSPILPSCKLLGRTAWAEIALESRSWYARVPTMSNIGDTASRLDIDEIVAALAGCVVRSVPKGIFV